MNNAGLHRSNHYGEPLQTMKHLQLTFLLALMISPALAQKNWVGTSTDWNAAANWSPAGVPSATDQIFVGACTSCPVLTANLSVSNLTVQDGGKLTIGANTLTATDIFAASNAEIISTSGTIDANRTGVFFGQYHHWQPDFTNQLY
jgi:hypothetical protein